MNKYVCVTAYMKLKILFYIQSPVCHVHKLIIVMETELRILSCVYSQEYGITLCLYYGFELRMLDSGSHSGECEKFGI
jgi:hypothetical protein